jgi:hypothetical protein
VLSTDALDSNLNDLAINIRDRLLNRKSYNDPRTLLNCLEAFSMFKSYIKARQVISQNVFESEQLTPKLHVNILTAAIQAYKSNLITLLVENYVEVPNWLITYE